MAKRTKDNDTVVIAALQRVTELMSSTSSELQQFISSHAAAGGAPAAVSVDVRHRRRGATIPARRNSATG